LIDQVLDEKLSSAPDNMSDFAFQAKQAKAQGKRKEFKNLQEEGFSMRS